MQEKYVQLLDKAGKWIEEHKQEFIEELQGLARIPSVSRADLAQPGAPFGPDCKRVLDYALERGDFWGFKTQNHEGAAGSITYGDEEETIGVIAHLDVVPVGEGWVYPTFGATYLPEYDVMIGRGAVSDPFLAQRIRGRMEPAPSAAEWPIVLGFLADYLKKLHARILSKHEHGRVKLWLGYLKRTWPQAAELHDAIRRLQDPMEIQRVIEHALHQGGRQTAPAG